MPKVSPSRNIFSGEISELAQGRVDLPRYAQSMRTMVNCVGTPLGPAVRRPGTMYQGRAISDTTKSVLREFVFNEDEVCALEFGVGLLRFWYDYNGLAAHREIAVTAIVTTSPLKFTAPGHDFVIGEHVILDGFDPLHGLDGGVGMVTAVAGNDVTLDTIIAHAVAAVPGTAVAAAVYEIATPYTEDSLETLSVVQWLDVVYIFCKDCMIHELKRYDTFDWRLQLHVAKDGPYLPLNTTSTKLIPVTKGSWVPDMTSNTLPSGVAAADSEAVGHEAFRAFDGIPDNTYWMGTTKQTGWLEYQFTNNVNANLIPLMTAPATGGVTMSASSATNPAWWARDGDNGTDWLSSGTVPQWIKVQFAGAHTILQYSIRASRKLDDFHPRNWTFEGSNDNIAWTVVDTRVGETFDSGQRHDYIVAAPAAFIYYRINVSKVTQHNYTVVHPKVGKPNRPGFHKAYTTTTKSLQRVAIANLWMVEASANTFKVANGYTIHVGIQNDEDAIDTKAHMPQSWTFEGYDGSNWTILDSRRNYDDWHFHRSSYFNVKNRDPYQKYRLNITECYTHGDVKPRIGLFSISTADSPSAQINASSKIGINDNQGFLPTDVGRLIRMRDYDDRWRWGVIDSVVDVDSITVNISGNDAFITRKQITDWRLGFWSDTTGYPVCGTIFEERLWSCGCLRYPDTVFSSKQGVYENYAPSTPKDEVLDDNAIVVRCTSRKMSRARWMASDENSVIVGTGSGEFIVFAPTDEPLTARNVAARPASKRGSAQIEPVVIDSDVLYVQRSKRRLYVVGFNPPGAEKRDKYDSVNISMLAGHLAFPYVVELTYEQDPFSLIWACREDGTLIALTYEKATDIIGGHRHDVNGFVEAVCAIPSPTDAEYALWMVVVRNINGIDHRYVERMGRYWDQDMTLQYDAVFVDCALRYYPTAATQDFYNLWHLEAETVDILADGLIYRNLVVTNGHIHLPQPVIDYFVVGKGYKTDGEITGLEEGAADGTAQGKSKRPHNVVIRLWDSFLGDVGRWNEDQGMVEYTPIEYPVYYDALTPIVLQTAMVGPLVLPQGYGKKGSVFFHQEDPLPFNVVALYPQEYVSDRQAPQGT